MKVLSAVVLLLAVSGLALGFTDLIRAGTNAARGSINAGNSLMGQSFGRRQNGQQNGASGNGQQAISGRPKQNGQQNQASGNSQQEIPRELLTVSSPPEARRNEGRPKQNGQQNQASANIQEVITPESLTISSPPEARRNEDLAQSLGGGPNSLVGNALSSARNAANTASSMTGLSRVTSALSLATFLTNPWVTWLIEWCNRIYLSVSPYLVALSIPRLL